VIDLTFRESSSERFDNERVERLSSESVSLVATVNRGLGTSQLRIDRKE